MDVSSVCDSFGTDFGKVDKRFGTGLWTLRMTKYRMEENTLQERAQGSKSRPV